MVVVRVQGPPVSLSLAHTSGTGKVRASLLPTPQARVAARAVHPASPTRSTPIASLPSRPPSSPLVCTARCSRHAPPPLCSTIARGASQATLPPQTSTAYIPTAAPLASTITSRLRRAMHAKRPTVVQVRAFTLSTLTVPTTCARCRTILPHHPILRVRLHPSRRSYFQLRAHVVAPCHPRIQAPHQPILARTLHTPLPLAVAICACPPRSGRLRRLLPATCARDVVSQRSCGARRILCSLQRRRWVTSPAPVTALAERAPQPCQIPNS
ncbi:hypothetical protein FA95DRAFT_771161 [Auriscalpium vulgare]|uniref:Uncharacterized protein n=1 Tax=Auriscalpium vulgare TaxID=40419 RepID=A0ACB8RAR4_9AGAM|nr:hypothetical protein FA95DRAFT_771161 [Auriscalpium vulgare]